MLMEPRNQKVVSDAWCKGSKSTVATHETADVSRRIVGDVYVRSEGSPKHWETMKIF